MKLCVVAAVSLSLAACASSPPEAPTLVQADAMSVVAPVQASSPVIGSIQTRDHKMTIHATTLGPRFTVASRRGRVLSRDLTPDQLGRRHQFLHELYRTSTASSYLDARLDRDVVDNSSLMP